MMTITLPRYHGTTLEVRMPESEIPQLGDAVTVLSGFGTVMGADRGFDFRVVEYPGRQPRGSRQATERYIRVRCETAGGEVYSIDVHITITEA